MKPMTDDEIGTEDIISFGPFRVDRPRRLIERNGQAVQVGSRACENTRFTGT
jgi:hypothetical protein